MGLGYALLLFAVRGSEMRIVGLALGAVAMTSVVVTRQIVSLRENQELATTDTLTGLVNRRHLYDRLRIAIGRRGRGGTTIAAVLIDMNGFKQVNDTMGHEAGRGRSRRGERFRVVIRALARPRDHAHAHAHARRSRADRLGRPGSGPGDRRLRGDRRGRRRRQRAVHRPGR
jgi:hypothetical protein